jgi:transcriptional regulator with XRE-family HTH domain
MATRRAAETDNGHSSLGNSIRQLRTRRGVTAKTLAEKIGVSPSLISKVESGSVNPSVDVLRRITMELHTTLADLMDPQPQPIPAEASVRRSRPRIAVVKANERKLLRVPRSGMLFQLLTPDVQGAAEFVLIELEPDEGGHKPYAHDSGEESVLVLEGTLVVYIEGEPYRLDAGDSLTFDATLPHLYRNEGDVKSVWLYLAVPPTL